MKPMIAAQVLIKKEIKFYKAGRYEMAEAGRWGPAWLHRLIIRMAMNCGIVRPAMAECEVYHHHALPRHKLTALHPMILNYLDNGICPDDLVIYCGTETWPELVSHKYFRSVYAFEHGRMIGDRAEHRLLDIPTYIIPDMTGMIVVPRPERIR